MIERVKSKPKTQIELSDTHLTNISKSLASSYRLNMVTHCHNQTSIPCICEVLVYLVYAKLIIY